MRVRVGTTTEEIKPMVTAKAPLELNSDGSLKVETVSVDAIMKECAELKVIIQIAYEEGVTLPEAEKLAARFLYAQMMIAEELARSDLDSRMRKNGYKTLRAKVYLDIIQGTEKKPTEAQIAAQIDTNDTVSASQDTFERAQSHSESLQRYLEIFKDAHIYMRGIAKGRFE